MRIGRRTTGFESPFFFFINLLLKNKLGLMVMLQGLVTKIIQKSGTKGKRNTQGLTRKFGLSFLYERIIKRGQSP